MRARSLPEIRAVPLRLGRNLVDSAEASFRCYRRLFQSFGIAYGRPEFQRTYSRLVSDVRRAPPASPAPS